eukprot:maker-scaffold373_size192110-snap-gene-0.35 protein:Tk03504 transcript:maker-scaffold373_size192110-snap-gene-0.35-mRNA-1 annotation:"ubiquitin carboxyl-terminal hydrolase 17-like isoform x2"
MPIGQVYRSPVVSRVSTISSPFLELDAKQGGATVKRNFVVKKKLPSDEDLLPNGGEDPVPQENEAPKVPKKVKVVKKVKVKSKKNKENTDPTLDTPQDLTANERQNGTDRNGSTGQEPHENEPEGLVNGLDVADTPNEVLATSEFTNGHMDDPDILPEPTVNGHGKGPEVELNDEDPKEEGHETLGGPEISAQPLINGCKVDQSDEEPPPSSVPELDKEKLDNLYERYHSESRPLSEPERDPEYEPEKSIKVVERPASQSLPDHAKGLKNLGNTCFMNSIIQCLAHTQPILEFCQDFQLDKGNQVGMLKNKEIKIRSDAKSHGKITGAFANLVKDMWAEWGSPGGRDPVGSPLEFKREMGQYCHKFMGFEQHDSQEFLQYAQEGFHSEINQVPPEKKATKSSEKDEGQDENNNPIKTYARDDPEEPGLSAIETGRRWWSQYLKRDDSLVSDLFMGQFRSTLKCTVCSHESVTFEPFWLISVPIPSKGRSRTSNSEGTVKLQDCLDLFVAEETLDGDEKPTCEKCQQRQRCVKWYMVERWPRILVVHLKRFSPGERFRSKLSNHVDVPVEYLDLSSYSKSGAAHFDLYGVSNHSGTLHGGHYTAYCRHPYKKEKWHLYNDRAVSSTSKSGVISYEAYLLFFERKESELVETPVEEVKPASPPPEAEVEDEYEYEDGDEEW